MEVNLKNRYVPVAEIGYGTTDTTDDGTNIHYKASAPYFRIGMNYNFFFKKPYLPGFLYGGIRYGFTSFSYDVDAPTMKDPTWGFPEIPFSYDGIKTTVTWAELHGRNKGKCIQEFLYGLVTALPHTHEHEKDGTHRALVYSRFWKKQLD